MVISYMRIPKVGETARTSSIKHNTDGEHNGLTALLGASSPDLALASDASNSLPLPDFDNAETAEAAGSKRLRTVELGTPYKRPMSSSGRLSVDVMMMKVKKIT
ncbi:jg15906 [Pararge aegeria aegeria]|uniref:Jg15906 protein n=1 Tax=Pararge aegeria aegeria TaxID=348720 RepID=A0A8S4S2X7_9NEOP|nr:jg15906 [Pararge aegeria aegeria]